MPLVRICAGAVSDDRPYRDLCKGAYASTAASRPPPQDSRSGGSLLLFCRTLSFPTACRFIPALGYPAMAPFSQATPLPCRPL